MRFNKKASPKSDKKGPPKAHKKGVVGYNKKTALLEEAITHMNEGKYGRSSAALKELLALDPLNTEARRLFATLHLRLGSLISARTAFESLAREALERQDFWLAESLLREYLTAGPRCVPFLDMLGQVYEQKGDSMAAVAEYGKAIEVLVEDPDPDHPNRAADLFAKIRALAPGSPEALRLASLFDSSTGQLLSPPAVSKSASSAEEGLPVPEAPMADANNEGESCAVSLEQPAPSGGQPLETAQAALVTAPSGDVAPVADPTPWVPERIETQEVETPESLVTREDLGTLTPHDEMVPPAPPKEKPGEAADLPLKLAEESTPVPTQSVEPEAGPALQPDIGATGLSLEQETGTPVIDYPLAVPDLSLHEVTQPITDAPSTPLPMPWDQVQDTTLSIPLPSEGWETAQASETQAPNETETFSIPEPAIADDQPALPVQPEALLSSMSWEEILEAVGKGPDLPPDPKPAESGSAASPGSVLMPISEPVAEPQALPVPMPWEQVEEDSVPILQREPEPEFGVVPDNTSAPLVDDAGTSNTAGSSYTSDSGGEPNDGTVALAPTIAVQIETPIEPEQVPLASVPSQNTVPLQEEKDSQLQEEKDSQLQEEKDSQLQEEKDSQPILRDEPPVASAKPIEPPTAEPAPIPVTDHEVCLPTVPDEDAVASPHAMAAESETAARPVREPSVEPPQAQDAAPVQSDEPVDVQPAPEEVLPENRSLPSDTPAAEDSESLPPTLSLSEARPRPEEPNISSDQITRPDSPSQSDSSPGASQPATPSEIKILWDDQAQRPMEQGAGLLSRWLRRPKLDQPAPSGSSDVPSQEQAVESSTLAEPSPLAEPSVTEQTVSVTPSFEAPSVPSIPALPTTHDKKSTRSKIRKPLVGSLSARIRSGVIQIIGTCFSTTQSIVVSVVVLAVAIVLGGVAALGVAGLTWVLMEQRPNPAFHHLSATPERMLQEASRNGYLVLLGFDRGTNQDAAQAGLARTFERSDLAMAGTCLTTPGDRGGDKRPDAERTLAGWYRHPDPAARFRAQSATLRTWMAQADRSVIRYKQWLTMPFEDWGYGEPVSPNCPMISHAHRLYVADGFTQDAESGIQRLEADLAMWRQVMTRAKTLTVKMLAIEAVDDDVAILSGLLARPDLEEDVVGRLSKLARPLDPMEQSLRWPMQSELAAAGKVQDMILKQNSADAVPFYVSLVSIMPVPAQRRFNQYADYYEASAKAAGEGRFADLPKRSDFVRYPPKSWLDYGLNPIENILGVPPLPEWDTYGGRILELDAKLRLAGLQAWIRRSPPEQDIHTRMAKAGQALYDPFTGFPMLLNRGKGLIYSVGQDGKDHDGQPGHDIAAQIPSMPGGTAPDGKRGASGTKARR